MRPLVFLGLTLVLFSSCSSHPTPPVNEGTLDLRSWDWAHGSVPLVGTWAFDQGYRAVPDRWSASEAGGTGGQGSGTYRLKILLPAGSPPLALRYGTASTSLSLRVNGRELARVGNPSADPARDRPAYRPGSVLLPDGGDLQVEVFVSNHIYRVGGLWRAPVIGPADQVESDRWFAEGLALTMSSTLGSLGLFTLFLFAYRRSERAFLFSGLFALLVALRALVTGEYPLVRMLPGLPFDLLIRLEYCTAYLPLPVAAFFYSSFFPGLLRPRNLALMAGPPLAFGALIVFAPLTFLTQSINAYYPLAIVVMIVLTALVAWRVNQERDKGLLLAGTLVLAVAGVVDMGSSFFFSRTGFLLPWGLAVLVILQSTVLARQFLKTYERTRILLEQKEMLVKEIHHRVKNSLQVVASLVTLQANRTGDPEQKQVYQALRRRITAIALVHEKLYGKGGGRPDVGEYLRELLELQWAADQLDGGRVTWTVHAEPLAARDEFCIDSGLILTELVGNGLKHGGSGQGHGTVNVEVRIQVGRLLLHVEDDGPGFSEGFSASNRAGMGFRLIQALLTRNDGTLSFGPGPGGRVTVSLRVPTAAD